MADHLDTETLSAHLDGHSGAAAARIDAHLASCSQCAARQASLRGVVRSVGALPAVTPTGAEASALRTAVLAGARSGATGRAPGGGPWFSRWRQAMTWKVYAAGGAVAGLLAAGIGYAAFQGGQAAVTASGVGHRASQAIQAKAFASTSDVAVYVAQQPAVSDTVRSLTAAGIPATARQFEAALTATPQPAAAGVIGGQAQNRATQAAPINGALVAPEPTASTNVNGDVGTPPVPSAGKAPDFTSNAAAPLAPIPLGTLSSCVSATEAGAVAPTAPLEAAEITYQGQPAWLIVLAAFPPGATGAAAPTSLEIWVQARPACSLLAHTSLAP
ncbi:MAG TPA: hypothetical protein VFW71_07905 [Actinomycetota bacterium]|nr:hypothetical protein [Actinomycetota bacterium]